MDQKKNNFKEALYKWHSWAAINAKSASTYKIACHSNFLAAAASSSSASTVTSLRKMKKETAPSSVNNAIKLSTVEIKNKSSKPMKQWLTL